MTIPYTSFLLDGDTALVVVEGPERILAGKFNALVLDRPCDTCGGDLDLAEPEGDCTDCIDGRHAFDIEVYTGKRAYGFDTINTITVHVIDVLPIERSPLAGVPMVRLPDGSVISNILPPDAAPGQHLVRLAVHQ